MPIANLQRLGKALATQIELNDLTDFLTFNFIAVGQLPDSSLELDLLRKGLSIRLWLEFCKNYLTVEERRGMPRQIETSVPRSLHPKWDKFVLECGQQYGARLLLSDLVMTRVWVWTSGQEHRGSLKLKKLFDQMRRSARIGLRQAKGAITDRHRRFKSLVVPELKILRERLRAVWCGSADQVLEHAGRIIDKSSDLLTLRSNKEQLLKLLSNDGIALRFHGAAEKSKDDITPTQLCVKLLARSENQSEEYARQQLLTKKTKPRQSKN